MTEARRTQRLGAYAVAYRTDADGADLLLVTRISPVGYPAGYWTLAGGGVDHGESPHDAVRRELHEETGLTALSAQLVDVHDVHVVERGRNDGYEDYHGVHLLFRTVVDDSVEPHVVEVGGSTDVACWVRVDEIGTTYQPILPMLQHVLDHRERFR